MKQINMKEISVSEALAQIDAMQEVNPKYKGCLRLLSEEMFSMCKELLGLDVLDFDVSREPDKYVLRVATQTRITEKAREQFLSISSSGLNEANKGIKGIFYSVMEAFCFECEPAIYNSAWTYGMLASADDYVSMWKLSQYMQSVPEDKLENDWDGMEKSIIASFADDVAIGVRSGKLEMIITKNI